MKDALDAVVHVTLDQTDAVDARRLRAMRVNGFPTFVLLTAKGAEIERWSGFANARAFVKNLRQAAANTRSVDERIAAFAADPTTPAARRAAAAEARRLAASLDAAGRPDAALEDVDHACRLDPRLERELGRERLYLAAAAVEEGLVPFAVLEQAAARAPRTSKGSEYEIAQQMIRAWPEDRDRADLRRWVDPAVRSLRGSRASTVAARRELEAALQAPPTLDQRLAEFEKAPTGRGALDLARSLAYLEHRYPEALALYRKAAELDPELAAQASRGVLEALSKGLSNGADVPLADLEPAVASYLAANADKEWAPLTAAYSVCLALSKGQDDAYLAAQIEAGLAAADKLQSGPVELIRSELLVRKALTLEKDKGKARLLKQESMGEGWEEDATNLAEFARFLLENGYDLDEAERRARRAVELARDRGERASANDALADVLYARGRRAEAREALVRAKRAVPRWGHLGAKLARWDAEAAEPSAAAVAAPP